MAGIDGEVWAGRYGRGGREGAAGCGCAAERARGGCGARSRGSAHATQDCDEGEQPAQRDDLRRARDQLQHVPPPIPLDWRAIGGAGGVRRSVVRRLLFDYGGA
eukprot:6083096-Prymnesium_polylepis.1